MRAVGEQACADCMKCPVYVKRVFKPSMDEDSFIDWSYETHEL